jgi:hypothetical protein
MGRQLRHSYGIRLLTDVRVQRVALCLVLSLVLVFRAVQVLVYSSEIQWGYDFSAYWAAARHVLDGQPIYTVEQLAGPYSPQQSFLYLYPPFLAVAMTPFAALFSDYRLANWAWAAIGTALTVSSVFLVVRRERPTTGRDGLLLVGAALAFPPIIGEIVMGNVHLVLLGLLSAAWFAHSRPGGDWRYQALAGVLVGVAALVKIFPGLLILWFLLRRRWLAAGSALIAILLLSLVTLPVVGLESWLDYPTVLMNLGSPVHIDDTIAPTVWLSAFMTPSLARLMVVGGGLAVVLWSVRRRTEAVSFAITVAVSVLIAPALYHHYLAILVLPLLLLIRWAPPFWWIAVAYLLMFGGEQEALGDMVWVINRVLPTLGAVAVVMGALRFGLPRSGDPPVPRVGVLTG